MKSETREDGPLQRFRAALNRKKDLYQKVLDETFIQEEPLETEEERWDRIWNTRSAWDCFRT